MGAIGVTRRRLGSAVLVALLVSSCGNFQPFATPFVPRPALPPGDPWPVDAEVAVERLEALGYRCDFEPDSDIPGGWHCDGAEGVRVGFGPVQAGPIRSAGAMMFDEAAPAKDVMDRRAVTVFSDEVLAVLLPDAVVPSDEELLAMVQRNWPVELGDGWILGFDRASNQRTLHVRYVEPAVGQ